MPGILGFAERLRCELGATHVLFYGPRTRGDTRADASYDLILVATGFYGLSQAERLASVYPIFEPTVRGSPLHATCLTPEEFTYARGRPTFVHAVLPEAIDLLADDAHVQIAAIRPAHAPTLAAIEPEVRQFAERLHEEVGAERVILFGSRAVPRAPIATTTSLWSRGISSLSRSSIAGSGSTSAGIRAVGRAQSM